MTVHSGAGRWVWAEVDLGAIRHNVELLCRIVAPAGLWAVVKADGYGHGAADVAAAALDAGAAGLCVALASEGAVLRQAGIAAPILLLSEQPAALAAAIVHHGLTPSVVTADGIAALGAAASAAGRTIDVHLKIDTGMHRTGAAPADVPELVAHIELIDGVRLAGVFTHLAVADEPERPETAEQLERFDAVLAALGPAAAAGRAIADTTTNDADGASRALDPGAAGDVGEVGSEGATSGMGGDAGVDASAGHAVVAIHAANSAAALAHPAARRSFVRAGIAMYGIEPGPAVTDPQLRPALALKARVSLVKRLTTGERLSYGLRHELTADTNVATVPIGYADGVRRGLSGTGTAVLVGGRRCPIIGTITMDQLLVDVGDEPVAVGDEVVLIGRQGDEEIRAEEWAAALGTIGYEIVCGIGPRVPRRVLQ